MRTDIRMISIPDEFGGERYQVARIAYDDQGEIAEVQQVFHESATMGGALAFLDDVYKATLKTVLVKNSDGEWE